MFAFCSAVVVLSFLHDCSRRNLMRTYSPHFNIFWHFMGKTTFWTTTFQFWPKMVLMTLRIPPSLASNNILMPCSGTSPSLTYYTPPECSKLSTLGVWLSECPWETLRAGGGERNIKIILYVPIILLSCVLVMQAYMIVSLSRNFSRLWHSHTS